MVHGAKIDFGIGLELVLALQVKTIRARGTVVLVFHSGQHIGRHLSCLLFLLATKTCPSRYSHPFLPKFFFHPLLAPHDFVVSYYSYFIFWNIVTYVSPPSSATGSPLVPTEIAKRASKLSFGCGPVWFVRCQSLKKLLAPW